MCASIVQVPPIVRLISRPKPEATKIQMRSILGSCSPVPFVVGKIRSLGRELIQVIPLISIDPRLLRRLDRLVERQVFRSRSEAIQKAVAEKLDRLDRSRLARECAKLSPTEEQEMADEGLSEDFAEWPEY